MPTVLVAEDDDSIRRAAASVLDAEGYRVIEVADGASVLQLLARAEDEGTPPPDLLLLDFLMPGYSGVGVLRALRRFPRQPATIIMTGFPDPSAEVLARGFGARRFLRKPVDADVLAEAVRDVLGSRSRSYSGCQ